MQFLEKLPNPYNNGNQIPIWKTQLAEQNCILKDMEMELAKKEGHCHLKLTDARWEHVNVEGEHIYTQIGKHIVSFKATQGPE